MLKVWLPFNRNQENPNNYNIGMSDCSTSLIDTSIDSNTNTLLISDQNTGYVNLGGDDLKRIFVDNQKLSSFSISLWCYVKNTAANSDKPLASIFDARSNRSTSPSSNSDVVILLRYVQDHLYLEFSIYKDGTAKSISLPLHNTVTDWYREWMHIVASVDTKRRVISLYSYCPDFVVSGPIIGESNKKYVESSYSSSFDSEYTINYFRLGASIVEPLTTNTNFKGYMSDVRIYDHALSMKEISDLDKGLIAHYQLSVYPNARVDNKYIYAIPIKDGHKEQDISGFDNNIYHSISSAASNTTKYGGFPNAGVLAHNFFREFRLSLCLPPNNYDLIATSGSIGTMLVTPAPKSASFWIYLEGSFSQSNQIVFAHAPSELAFGFYGGSSAIIASGSTSRSSVFNIGTLSKQTWHFIVVTKDSSNRVFRLWIDGVEKTPSGNYNYWSNYSDKLTINGRGSNSTTYSSDISLADFRMYRTTLTNDDVQDLYHSGDANTIDDQQNIYTHELVDSNNNRVYLSQICGTCGIDYKFHTQTYMCEEGVLRSAEINEGSISDVFNNRVFNKIHDRNIYDSITWSTGDSITDNTKLEGKWLKIFHHDSPVNRGKFESSDDFYNNPIHHNEHVWSDMYLCNFFNKWEMIAVQATFRPYDYDDELAFSGMIGFDSDDINGKKWWWIQNVNPLTASRNDVVRSNITILPGSSFESSPIVYGGLYRNDDSAPSSFLAQPWYNRLDPSNSGNNSNIGVHSYTLDGNRIPGFLDYSIPTSGGVGMATPNTGAIDIYIRIDNDSIALPNEEVEYVDFDLPSGNLWAKYNLGATHGDNSTSWFGNKYAWGETATKSTYTWDNYKWGTSNNLTKYNSTDNKRTLDLTDDAATVNLGGYWKIPTIADFEELFNNTTYSAVSNYSGVTGLSGWLFTKDDKSIFFADASRLPHGGLSYTTDGLVLSSTTNSWYIDIHDLSLSGYYDQVMGERYEGNSIRPIMNKKDIPTQDIVRINDNFITANQIYEV